MGEFYELRNFMNTWSQEEQQQQQQELHESFVNRLYECKPVKSAFYLVQFMKLTYASPHSHSGCLGLRSLG